MLHAGDLKFWNFNLIYTSGLSCGPVGRVVMLAVGVLPSGGGNGGLPPWNSLIVAFDLMGYQNNFASSY